MAILRKKQTVYICDGGREFLDLEEAVQFETRLALYRFLEEEGVGRGGMWDTEMIRDFMLGNRQKLLELLSPEVKHT